MRGEVYSDENPAMHAPSERARRDKVYSVGQINAYIKNMFAQDFMMGRICVCGEVSNCKYHSSGHIYFSLKDKSGILQAVMFAGDRRDGLRFRMKEGDDVIVSGAIRVYERDGKYQLYAKSVTLQGAGLLYQRYEELKRRLEEMGMFAPEYKQPIPKYTFRIGVVTAPTGAAVRDIQNISRRRNPCVQMLLYPAQVQGEGAAQSIVNGIHALEAKNVDVIIVGRGGGSIEDLWAFNEEIVARAVFECPIPVISAVGHETDVTIIDYVADLRAPTPSAAAELAVFDLRQTFADLAQYKDALSGSLRGRLDQTADRIRQYQLRLQVASPQNQLLEKRQLSADFEDQLIRILEQRLTEYRNKIVYYAAQIDAQSPLKKLKGGYAFPTDAAGRRISGISDVKPKDAIRLYMLDGYLTATVEQTYIKESDGV